MKCASIHQNADHLMLRNFLVIGQASGKEFLVEEPLPAQKYHFRKAGAAIECPVGLDSRRSKECAMAQTCDG